MRSARLLWLGTSLGTPSAWISPTAGWPNSRELKAHTYGGVPKRWPDFIGHSPICEIKAGLHIVSGRVVADLLRADLADGDFIPLAVEKSPILYFAFLPRASIWVREVDVSAKLGHDEPSLAPAPEYSEYTSQAFTLGRISRQRGEEKCGLILCIPEILELAKAQKWTGVSIRGFDGGGTLYECNDCGKVVRENPEPPTSIVDDYYVPQEVIAADLVRARELAAELQASPDTPERTRRSFEIVRKALAEAPHTLGYPMPEAAKPRRVVKPGAPLLAPTAIKRLKLEGEGELQGEIELGRPFFGADTLSIIVSDEVSDDDAPDETYTKTEMKRRAQAALEKLESRLPAIETAIDAEAASREKAPADFRAALRDPRVFLCTADFAKGDRWTFIVEDDFLAHHFEFDGDRLIERWSGD